VRDQIKRVHLAVVTPATVVLTVIMVLGFWRLDKVLVASCDMTCGSFAEYERRDPLCVVDPTCVSPLYNPARGGVQRWDGAEWYSLPLEQELPSRAQVFAPPNCLALMAFLVTLVFGVERLGASMRWRRTFYVCVVSAVVVQVSLWFDYIDDLRISAIQPTHDLALIWEACTVVWISGIAVLAASKGGRASRPPIDAQG
jgi:hypothetical protein